MSSIEIKYKYKNLYSKYLKKHLKNIPYKGNDSLNMPFYVKKECPNVENDLTKYVRSSLCAGSMNLQRAVYEIMKNVNNPINLSIDYILEHCGSDIEVIYPDIEYILEALNFKSIINAMLIKEKENTISLYRGLSGKIARQIYESSLKNDYVSISQYPLSSWSGNLEMALEFATIRSIHKNGIVIIRDTSIEEVFGYYKQWGPYKAYPFEREYTIITSKEDKIPKDNIKKPEEIIRDNI